MIYKSDDNQICVTYKSLVLSHLTYKSGDLLKPNRPKKTLVVYTNKWHSRIAEFFWTLVAAAGNLEVA